MSEPAAPWDMARAFAGSSSFWSQTVPLLCAAAASLGALVALAALRIRGLQRTVSSFIRSEHGSAAAMDFVLTFPIALFVGLLFVQFLMAAHASLVVHYAAYSAARTARAIYWDISVDEVRAQQVRERLLGDNAFARSQYWRVIRSRNESRARAKAAVAARAALMAAVPSSQQTAGATPADAALVLKEIAPLNVSAAAARNKAAYAFSPANARILVEVAKPFERAALTRNLAGLRIDALPIHAQVTFRYPLRMPVGRLLGTLAPTGGYYREITAHVQVL